VSRLRRVLVANRGEIARRVFRTARSMGLSTVAVYSDADSDAPYVAEADLAVRLPGVAPGETYLRADLHVAAARATASDCVHPGYGFLSENATFAAAVRDAGLVWVGPPAEAMAAMGDKRTAKQVMARAGVPVLPSAPPEAAASLGFPLLVKAAFGGGGRGMRAVRRADDLPAALTGAEREAAAAFGDGSLFCEPLVPSPRHVEVQILADRQGGVVALFERECSIQRRHQKLVEEAPSPAVDGPLRERLAEAATAAARAIGYTGAGTVEFILAPDGAFYFLEVNTRLQVEHPVTEAVTGLDLVRLQFTVAAGEPLPAAATAAALSGHAIEARLYAEDPMSGWLPQAGPVHTFRLPADAEFRPCAGAGVRVDAGVADGDVVSRHYDPLLAKVIAWAPTRGEAAARLADALARARLHGPVTGREVLVGLLRHPAFLAGETDTGFLDRHPPETLAPRPDLAVQRLHAAVAALAGQALRRSEAGALAGLPSGWRNNPALPQSLVLTGPEGGVTGATRVHYRFGRGGLLVEVDEQPLSLTLHGCRVADADERRAGRERQRRFVNIDVSADAGKGPVRTVVEACRVVAGQASALWFVDSVYGASVFREAPRFPEPVTELAPGSLTAPMPGGVARIEVAVGDRVRAGQRLLVLEAMKMEHPVVAPRDGTVADLPAGVGVQVEAGTVLVVVKPTESEGA
jgi:propionyl-CoA carboxylase alpha chain